MKIIGDVIAIPVPSKQKDFKILDNGNISNGEVLLKYGIFNDSFTLLGTSEELKYDSYKSQMLLPNSMIDYMDLNKMMTTIDKSFLSWLEYYHLNDRNYLFLIFSTYKGYEFKYFTKLPKTASKEEIAEKILKLKDPSLNKFIMNKYKTPEIRNGYYIYDLDNFNIVPGIYYTVTDYENKHVIYNTSVDINKMNVLENRERIDKLYQYMIDKVITIL